LVEDLKNSSLGCEKESRGMAGLVDATYTCQFHKNIPPIAAYH
jgi:hypothetical protein